MDILESKFIKFGAWCGIGIIVFMLGGLAFVAGFLPPHPPSADAQTIADIYENDAFRIRVGMILMMFTCTPMIFFMAALSALLRQLEGRAGVLTMSMLVSGYGLVLLVYLPAIWWLIGAFRLERGAEVVHLFNDIGWLQFVGGLFISWPMFLILATAGFVNKGDDPIFPRWFGFFNAWAAVLFLPGQLVFFLQTGPFAWNGLFAFHIPLLTFLVWTLVCTSVMLKAAKRRG